MASIHAELDAMEKNDLQIFHSKHVNVSPNMKLVTSLINFECQPCGISEGL